MFPWHAHYSFCETPEGLCWLESGEYELKVKYSVNRFSIWIRGFAIFGQVWSKHKKWVINAEDLKTWSLNFIEIDTNKNAQHQNVQLCVYWLFHHIILMYFLGEVRGLISGRCGKGLFACMCHEEVFAQCLSFCLSLCLPFLFFYFLGQCPWWRAYL